MYETEGGGGGKGYCAPPPPPIKNANVILGDIRGEIRRKSDNIQENIGKIRATPLFFYFKNLPRRPRNRRLDPVIATYRPYLPRYSYVSLNNLTWLLRRDGCIGRCDQGNESKQKGGARVFA